MLSLRLEKDIEEQLDSKSKMLGITKSELVRLCIHKFLGTPQQLSAWELGKNSFGKFSSGDGTLSQNKRKSVSTRIKAKKG